MKTKVISAIFIEETGEVKCGYCGKKQFCLQKNTKKCQKTVDKSKSNAIISIKCSRCETVNRLEI
jgi:uncharacterized Zn-finger protein